MLIACFLAFISSARLLHFFSSASLLFPARTASSPHALARTSSLHRLLASPSRPFASLPPPPRPRPHPLAALPPGSPARNPSSHHLLGPSSSPRTPSPHRLLPLTPASTPGLITPPPGPWLLPPHCLLPLAPARTPSSHHLHFFPAALQQHHRMGALATQSCSRGRQACLSLATSSLPPCRTKTPRLYGRGPLLAVQHGRPAQLSLATSSLPPVLVASWQPAAAGSCRRSVRGARKCSRSGRAVMKWRGE